MHVKYMGPRDYVNVAPYGRHTKNQVKEYPDDFGEELLATSTRNEWEVVDAPTKGTGKKKAQEEKDPGEAELESAAEGATVAPVTEDETVAEAAESAEEGEVSEEEAAEIPLKDLTNAELIARCQDRGIEVPKKPRKAELIELLGG